MPTFALILISSVINTAAQLLLKAGADRLKVLSWSHWYESFINLISNPYLFLGLCCYVVSVGVWIIVLSRVPVSVAHPISSLAYITTAISAAIIFNEYLSLTRIMGIFVIIFGVYLIARTN
ncbi:MAG: EamA family transporter [Gammaproteobacteria bacterium]|nr:EamA family transporter [Gammaproteobacteria bacterium]